MKPATAHLSFVTLDPGGDRAARCRDDVLEGLVLSGGPFAEWLHGGTEPTRRHIATWMDRPSSEVFLGRVTVGLVDDRPVGGYVSIPGAEVGACWLADAMALLADTHRSSRSAIRARLEAASALFPVPADDELYLSRIWTTPGVHGAGHGLALGRHWLATAREAGFRRFRTDIAVSNVRVQRFARFFGFEKDSESFHALAGTGYMRFTRAYPPG